MDENECELEHKKAIIESIMTQQENRELRREICNKLDQLMIAYNKGLIHSLPMEKKRQIKFRIDKILNN